MKEIFELFIDEESELGVDCISIVDYPATEIEAHWFSKIDVSTLEGKDSLMALKLLKAGQKDKEIATESFVATDEAFSIIINQESIGCWSKADFEAVETILETLLKVEFKIEDKFKVEKELGRWIFNDQGEETKFLTSTQHQAFSILKEEERKIIAPIMIPDKKMPRLDSKNKPYWVFFKAETIAAMSEKYMKELKIHNSNLNHDSSIPLKVRMTESWIVEDSKRDKSALYGFNLPKGSWVGIFIIEEDEIWKNIKEGKLKGVSLEGKFASKKIDSL